MVYTSLYRVEEDCKKGIFKNEAELRQAFVEALKTELEESFCKDILAIARNYIIPRLDEMIGKGKPDVRIFNIVIEVEPPNKPLDKGRKQLHDYMNSLRSETDIAIHGLVTNGIEAEYWLLDNNELKCKQRGSMAQVVGDTFLRLCSEKMVVVKPEDITDIFGV